MKTFLVRPPLAPRVPMLVIWAIDAIREPGTLLEHSAAVLDEWASRLPLQVEPVFILTPSQLDLALTPDGRLPMGVESRHRAAAERALAQVVDQHSANRSHLRRSLLPPVVLMEHRTRTRAAVEALENHARSRGAMLVALPTHGRRGVARFLLGSFAETLLLQARVPTLAIGPGVETVPSLERMAFATDFAPGSKELFREVVGFASRVRAKLWLYHSVPNLVEPIFQSGAYLFSGAWIPARNYFAEEVQQRYRRGMAWARWAENQGVECNFILDESMGSISDHILQLLKSERIGLAAIASRSGPVASTILGSICRQVVRSASCPVWILHPGEAAAVEEKPRALAG